MADQFLQGQDGETSRAEGMATSLGHKRAIPLVGSVAALVHVRKRNLTGVRNKRDRKPTSLLVVCKYSK